MSKMRRSFRVNPQEVEAETKYVLDACLNRIHISNSTPASELLAPQVPVTELSNFLQTLREQYYDATESSEPEGKHNMDDMAKMRGLPSNIKQAYAAGVLWLHLRRRAIPLIPYEMFARMTTLALELEPLDDIEDAYTDAYANAVDDALLLDDLRKLILLSPVENRRNIFLVLQYIHNTRRATPQLNSLEAIASVGPILGKPKDTTFMSIRHRRELGLARLIMSALLDNLAELEDVWMSSEPPTKIKAGTKYAGDQSRVRAASCSSTLSPSVTSSSNSSGRPRMGSISKSLESVAEITTKETPRKSLSIVTVDDKIFSTPEQPDFANIARDENIHPAMDVTTKIVNDSVHRVCLGDISWLRFAKVSAASVASPVPLASKPGSLRSPMSNSDTRWRTAMETLDLNSNGGMPICNNQQKSFRRDHLMTSNQDSRDSSNATRCVKGTQHPCGANGGSSSDTDECDRAEDSAMQQEQKQQRQKSRQSDSGLDMPARLPEPRVNRSASEGQIQTQQNVKNASRKLVEGRLERAFEKAHKTSSSSTAGANSSALRMSPEKVAAAASAITSGPETSPSPEQGSGNQNQASGDKNNGPGNDNNNDSSSVDSQRSSHTFNSNNRCGTSDEERETVTTDTLRVRLETDKRALKTRLKKFDEEFAQVHGRKPSRLEKEPIRHLYEEYNMLKRRISELAASSTIESVNSSVQQSRSGSDNSMDASGSSRSFQGKTQRAASLQALSIEKRNLQAQLREFERRFEQDNNRRIRCAADITGLEREYRRYKELKEILSQYGHETSSPSSSRSPRLATEITHN